VCKIFKEYLKLLNRLYDITWLELGFEASSIVDIYLIVNSFGWRDWAIFNDNVVR
jgi:hypothetical protein